jgi:hypothetical protein
MRCVRHRVAMLSIMSLIPSYTHKNKIKIRVLLPVVHRRSSTGWGHHNQDNSGRFDTSARTGL